MGADKPQAARQPWKGENAGMILQEMAQGALALGRDLSGMTFPETIDVSSGAAARTVEFLSEKGHRNAVMACDAATSKVAGTILLDAASSMKLALHPVLIDANAAGDVVADEASVVQLLLSVQQHRATAIVAAGSGTIHDLSRYAAYTASIPFVSVPTAPSVDGFTSLGAPLLIRGMKTTVSAVGPSALFADTDLLRAAPAPLVASGFGDMLGKLTSLLDWRIEARLGLSPYDEWAAAMTEDALESCIRHAGSIASRSAEGITALTEALIRSGLAMLILGSSNCASGAEHHLSHYWEMELHRTGQRQLLHGAKVGAASALISSLYKRIAASADGSGRYRDGEVVNAAGRKALERHWPEIQEWIGSLPEPGRIRDWLRSVGGPVSPQELGLPEQLVENSLREADKVRPNRFTLLRAYNRY